MTEEKQNGTSTIAVEEGKSETPAVDNNQNGGEKVTQPTKEDIQQPFKVFNTQNDFDNLSAKIKGNAERDIFKKLGIKDETELEKIKTAYQASLTQEEKNAQALAELDNYKKQVLQKDFIINALAKNANEAVEDVEKQVIMAESLLSAGRYSTFDEAFEFVRGVRKQEEKPPVPQGKKIEQPDTQTVQIKNPFKRGEGYNLQAQSELFKKDRTLAIKLAKEAGLDI